MQVQQNVSQSHFLESVDCQIANAMTDDFCKKVISCFGEVGISWLNNLTEKVYENLIKYDATIINVCDNLSLSFVARVNVGGVTNCVMKICVLEEEAEREVRALKLLNGDSIAKVYHYAPGDTAFLVEDIRPGRNLFLLEEKSERITTVAHLMDKIWCCIDDDIFPSTGSLLDKLRRLKENIPENYVIKSYINRAESILIELVNTKVSKKLLHGDLHHKNVLNSSECGWKIIDPKGIIGDPAYEVSAYILDSSEHIMSEFGLCRGLDFICSIFSEILLIDKLRIYLWCFCSAVIRGMLEMDISRERAHMFFLMASAVEENIHINSIPRL